MSHPPAQGSARLLSPALLGWLAGIALQLQQAQLWSWSAYAALVLVAAVLLTASRHPATAGWPVARIFVALALLGFASTGLRGVLFERQTLNPALEGRDVQIIGRISAMPQFGENSTRFRFSVEEAQSGKSAVHLPPTVLLSWYGPSQADDETLPTMRPAVPVLHAGERWQFTVRLRAPHGARNPHGFDYELWLWEQGIQATGYVRSGKRDPVPQLLGQTWRHPVEWARQQVRDAILERTASSVSAPDESRARATGVVAALVTGDQRSVARADWDVFRATGVAHLMSISGLHITLFAWLAGTLLRALWRTSSRLCLRYPAQHAGLIGGLALATAYAVFSGWGVPAQRTLIMLATVTLLRLSAREWPWPSLWLLAAALVLAADPWAMLQPGFWLSFVAVGILFAGAGRELVQSRRSVRQRMGALFREQALITLALAPLTLLLFGQVSLVGLLANLIAIPAVTLGITPLALLGAVWAPSWDVAALGVQALGVVLEQLAALPMATLARPHAPLWAGMAGVLGALLLVVRLPGAVRFSGLPLLVPLLFWQSPSPQEGQFELLGVDIGQGNAVLIRTANHALLYDTGPRYTNESDAGQRVLRPLLDALGVRPDLLVLSHRDSDHTGGAASVLSAHPEMAVLSSIEAAHPLQALRAVQRCDADQTWEWDGVRFKVLHPSSDDYTKARNSNALSCVIRIDNGRQAVLLTGDIEQAQEARLLASGRPMQADLLLVPHHGSRTSSSAPFLDAVAPHMALVQAGYLNRFGHPASDVLQRYQARAIRVYTSDRCGAAYWNSENPAEMACEREVRRRYWQHRQAIPQAWADNAR